MKLYIDAGVFISPVTYIKHKQDGVEIFANKSSNISISPK